MKNSLSLEQPKADGYLMQLNFEPLVCPYCKKVYFSGNYHTHLRKCGKDSKHGIRRSFNGMLYLTNDKSTLSKKDL